MGIEIERKFLVKNDTWRASVQSERHIVQGYLATTGTLTLRVRIKDDEACLTIKGPPRGLVRSEFEYAIPVVDAQEMLSEFAIVALVTKVRFRVGHADHVWEVDVFEGENTGLELAEIELQSEHESFRLPSWAGDEVTGDPRYSNANLARRPFKDW